VHRCAEIPRPRCARARDDDEGAAPGLGMTTKVLRADSG
jgi:hypothetical protein